ncbi:hypothetical protein BAE44_0014097 [Dichanthelium oligosanthes]|uniref:Secreted protein n=1 Tax=Dichanthelium oligosanthes TaxID=888268 RepID=A0A1E5VIK7_9POAL|nr:hypothetical protein BAE44_0014097 [Dichanthelium oligosanthes]
MAMLLLMAPVESASATGWSTIDGGYLPSNLGARKLLQVCLKIGWVCPIDNLELVWDCSTLAFLAPLHQYHAKHIQLHKL